MNNTLPSSALDAGSQQRLASNPTASVWVNASAGSGKTTILTSRVTRLLLNGVRPEKILCLTYTRAGAAEMSNRVTETLSKWATCDDNLLSGELARLQGHAPDKRQMNEARRLFARVLSCPGGLRIRTIHSFCQEILSRFPIEAGLPPHFALIDEQDMDILRKETIDDLLRTAQANPLSALAKHLEVLVATQGEKTFVETLDEFQRAHAQISEAIDRAGSFEAISANIYEFLHIRPTDTPAYFRDLLMEQLPEEKLRYLAACLSQGAATNQARSRTLNEILEIVPSKRGDQFSIYQDLFLTSENTLRKNLLSKDLKTKHPELESICEEQAGSINLALERIEAADIAQKTVSVLSFGQFFSKHLAKRKAARAALDYDDLIRFTQNLLERSGISPWILYKLDNGIDHILVDEAQDTSQAQWKIVQALTEEFYAGKGAQESKNRTLFVVGDEKQSIFSFQNADPEGFLFLRSFFDKKLNDAGKKLEKIGLHTSFRSAPAILRAVDTIFAHESTRVGVSPDLITHIASRNLDNSEKIGHVEVWPLLKPFKEPNLSESTWLMPLGYEEEIDPQAELAQQIARKIKSWLTNKEVLAGSNKAIQAGDVMILLRRRGRFADLMVRALKSHAVPVTGVDRMRLINQLPVMDLLAVIRFILLPEDDLNLAALLRSPLIGLSEEELMELAIGRPSSLWKQIQKIPNFSHLYSYFNFLIEISQKTTPFAFLSYILNSSCPASNISGRKALWARLGDESLDPIEELLNKAQSFGGGHSPSLQNFLHWLLRADVEIKRELDHGNHQNGGQVRIMTVHASKGLEAPIVFLPDTVATPRSADLPKFQWSSEGVPLFLSREPQARQAHGLWRKARDKQLQEYRRLFYVALTRASARLYICGWLGNKGEEAPHDSWYHLASTALLPEHSPHHHSAGNEPVPEIVFGDTPTTKAPVPAEASPPKQAASIPNWAYHSLPPSVAQLIPSNNDTPTATPDVAFARGRIIHRLLQSLPNIEPSHRASAINRFLSHPRHRLKQLELQEIANEVTSLLNNLEFASLFSADSLVEAPLVGQLNGEAAFRQVDRLCVFENEVWVVDYKTNRPPPSKVEDIPDAYRLQLEEYRILLKGIYPRKKIRCFLLWTFAPRLMEVPPEL